MPSFQQCKSDARRPSHCDRSSSCSNSNPSHTVCALICTRNNIRPFPLSLFQRSILYITLYISYISPITIFLLQVMHHYLSSSSQHHSITPFSLPPCLYLSISLCSVNVHSFDIWHYSATTSDWLTIPFSFVRHRHFNQLNCEAYAF